MNIIAFFLVCVVCFSQTTTTTAKPLIVLGGGFKVVKADARRAAAPVNASNDAHNIQSKTTTATIPNVITEKPEENRKQQQGQLGTKGTTRDPIMFQEAEAKANANLAAVKAKHDAYQAHIKAKQAEVARDSYVQACNKIEPALQQANRSWEAYNATVYKKNGAGRLVDSGLRLSLVEQSQQKGQIALEDNKKAEEVLNLAKIAKKAYDAALEEANKAQEIARQADEESKAAEMKLQAVLKQKQQAQQEKHS
jgi:hypothetical protein